MKKTYNRATMIDMPIDDSINPSVEQVKTKKTTTTSAKIKTIGKKTTSNSGKKSGSATKKTSAPSKSKKTRLNKTVAELDDLEKINEENIRNYQFRSKRNKVVIAVLSVLLVIAISVITTYLIIERLRTNCYFHTHGNAEAVYIIDDLEVDRFRAPANLQGNRIYRLDINVKIESGGFYNVRFTARCFQSGILLQNTLIYEHNTDLFVDGGDGYYYSKNPINGYQTIHLCGGIIIDYDYKDTLNVNNFRLDFHTYLEKV